ncbi:DinB family protein [Streptomyces sp. NPDC091682]|uniref:DinB family protein n=1 Tax=Streptomyces sp. NPDC091682 TaxID=3366005 RepID=UPI0037F94289
MMEAIAMDRQAVYEDYERARRGFHQLLESASEADLARPSRGTKWTNEQLLWHMLIGYMVVRALLVLVHVFGRLPRGAGKAFARLLDAGTVPFDWVNYEGPRGAVKVYGPRRMGTAFDRVLDSLQRRLAAESDADLARGMHYPVRWDPFFKDFMTLADVYRYPTQHFDFHHRQLTLNSSDGRSGKPEVS